MINSELGSQLQPVIKDNIEKSLLVNGRVLLKNAWRIYKNRFWTLIGLAATPVALKIAGTFLFVNAASIFATKNYLIIIPTALLSIAIFVIGIVLMWWSLLALFYAVKGADENIGFRKAFRLSWGKQIWSFIWIAILMGLVNFGGFILFIIPGLIFTVWFILSQYVFVIEGHRGFDALLRSKEYVSGRWWAVFGRIFGFTLFVFFVSIPFIAIFFLIFAIAPENIFQISSTILSQLFSLLLVPLTAAYFYSLYVALRETRPQLASQSIRGKKGFFIFCVILGVLMPVILILLSVFLVSLNFVKNKAKLFKDVGENNISGQKVDNKKFEATAFNDQGLDYFNKKDYENAEMYFRKAIETDSNLANPYNNLGIVLSLTGRQEEALENYKKAISVYPQYANAYSNIGVYYREKGDFVQAIDNFQKAIGIDPNHFKANMHLGDIYTIKMDYKSAEYFYKKALESNQIDPQSIDAIQHQLEYLKRLELKK